MSRGELRVNESVFRWPGLLGDAPAATFACPPLCGVGRRQHCSPENNKLPLLLATQPANRGSFTTLRKGVCQASSSIFSINSEVLCFHENIRLIRPNIESLKLVVL